jgi:hypothetical protein
LSGARWTTGIGIALGGVGGAVAALVGAPASPPPAPAALQAVPPVAEPALPAAEPALPAASARDAAPITIASLASAESTPVTPPAPSPRALSAPALELPSARDGLLKAMLFCDQKKDFDECERAAGALEKGTAGPPDTVQAKRFRRIALTHLVSQCESGAPHACFVLAAKYRAGTELAASVVSAQALEKRGLELCRHRSAPECPPP